MSGARYSCKNPGRLDALRAQQPPKLNGIDFLEVSADQKTLEVHFAFNLPGQANPVPPAAPALTAGHVLIEGGTRIQGIEVKSVAAAGNVLTVKVDRPGDFSAYTLRLAASSTSPEPPPDFDPRLSAVEFSFKVACPSDFDCQPDTECPPAPLAEPRIDYLAKDYATFRRLVLDRLSVLMPDWRERSPADIQVTLVELLAYVGDHLSYFQDAVATEAYLGTARRRTSVRRHARQLDYFVHEGSNARSWVHFQVNAGVSLPAGTPLLTGEREAEVRVDPAGLERLLAAEALLGSEPLVFETLHGAELRAAHNRIDFYSWSDAECCLPCGSTRATLLGHAGLALERGDVLVFEEILDPATGNPADADPAHRWAVRLTQARPETDPLTLQDIVEIEWEAADALPFPLCLSALVERKGQKPEIAPVSVARGNIVLADHGRTIRGETLLPEVPLEGEPYRPRLRRPEVIFSTLYDHERVNGEKAFQPASAALVQDPRQALPRVGLQEGDDEWKPARDLLGSDRFSRHFVLEVERDGEATLRFGDGVLGRAPAAGASLVPVYRIGSGNLGNAGSEAISRVVTPLPGIGRVRNPLPAGGGREPESLEEVRQFAPQAFRVQQRAVTEADWAEVAQRHPEVQRARARFRWTGSWHTVFLAVDRKGGAPVDAEFERALRLFLERFRLAGYDLEIDAPVFVPLDLLLMVCVAPGYFRGDVQEELLRVFDNRSGFFHPDRFTFGEPVWLSRIVRAAMAVEGVASVEVKRFQRWGKEANREMENGILATAPLEIVRLDNDPSFPENGRIELDMRGGQ